MNKIKRTYLLILMLTLFVFLNVIAGFPLAFLQSGEETEETRPEVISMLGKELFATPAEGEALAQLKRELKDAWDALQADPRNPDNVIMYGRRLAYLWRYHEAIDVFTGGIKDFPDVPMLYRHRGHRNISIRKFDRAVQDLAMAAEMETGDFDIWYHLGLAHYLQGNFEQAFSAYQSCLGVAGDDESKVAISNWLYITLRRMQRLDDAIQVINEITEDMQVEENQSYFDLLLFYKGQKSLEEIFNMEEASDLDLATKGYGIGCWYLYNNDADTARSYFEKIVDTKYWPAFGFIAAEAELARLK